MGDRFSDRKSGTPGSSAFVAAGAGVPEEKVRFARLLRRARTLGLSSGTLEMVREAIFVRLGLLAPAVETPQRLSPGAPAASPYGASSASPSPLPQVGALDAVLRQKVNAGAPWSELRDLAWQRLTRSPDVETAAAIVELAFLHGSVDEAGATLERVRGIGPDFYLDIHGSVREKLGVALWETRYKASISELLLRERDHQALRGIEKRLVFHILAAAKDPAIPWMYFRSHQASILEERHFPVPQALSVDATLLKAARVGLELGHDELARSLLDEIPADSLYRDEALQVLCSISYEPRVEGTDTCDATIDIVRSESDWREKLNLLHGLLAQVRQSSNQPDRRRSSINELLRAPLGLMPKSEAAWRQLAALLVSYRDLEPVLPNLLEVFRQNAGQFHAPALDFALWVAFLDEEESSLTTDTVAKAYWIGVAKLHQFVAQGPRYESCLWRGRELVALAAVEWDRPVPVQWRDLVHAAATACAAATHHFEYDRQLMVRQCRVAHERDLIAVGDIEEYLKKNDLPAVGILSELIEVCRKRKADSLEFRLIMIRARSSHLVNRDLQSCWRMAIANSCWDDAWRTATILRARAVLTDQVRFAWDMSGENRSRYSFNVPQAEHLQSCLFGLPQPVARLITGCLSVGPRLPELFAIKYPNVRAVNPFMASLKNPDTELDKALDKIPWMPARERGYVFSYELDSAPGSHLPAFIHVLPQNVWSQLVLRICDRMGMHVWSWKISMLQKVITELVQRGSPVSGLQRQTSKVARWMRDLTPEQRSSWQEIAGLARVMDDAEAQIGIAKFVCRMATVICQSHFEALTSLQQMRAPVAVTWDLESWILSNEYTKIRQAMGTISRVPVPASLQNAELLTRSDH
jgi:hypothetical protein